MFLCLTCKADEACINFKALEEKGFGFKCPTKGCDGELLHLDDGIAEALVLFNDKGYPTLDSCGGHFNNAEGVLSCYVVFEKGKVPPVEGWPEGFRIQPGDGVTITGDMVFFYDDNGEIPAAMFTEGNRTLQILEVNRRLMEWAMAVPATALL